MRACALLFLLVLPAVAQTADDRLLEKHGIQPTRESIGRYLRFMFPDPPTRARIEYLIDSLGDPETEVRDAAMRELIGMHAAPLAALQRATASETPEVRNIVRGLIQRAQVRLKPAVLYVVFQTIRRKNIPGLAPAVLNSIPLAVDFHVRAEAKRALLATVRPSDLPTLLEAAREGDAETRGAAFLAIRKIAPKTAPDILVPALRERDERVRAAAARQLAELGDRRALPVLVDLLAAADEQTRFEAVWTLRAISGKSFKYSGNAAVNQRAKALSNWRAWLAQEGKTVEWKSPLKLDGAKLGRVLVAFYSLHKVIEFDSAGNILWQLDKIKNPWAVHGLPNGHRLIVRYSEHVIVEYDASGRLIWESQKLGGIVSSVCELRNGNLMVAFGYNQNRIIEISREKKAIVWQLTVPGRPVCVEQLPNGNMLVTLNQTNEVVEMDRTGRRIWKVGNLKQPYSARRLANGNTLVADYGGQRVIEFNETGEKVWEQKGAQWLYTAARFPDGSTMLSDKAGLKRVDSLGRVIWKYDAKDAYTYLHRY